MNNNIFDLSGAATVGTKSRYLLDRVDPSLLSEKIVNFFRDMLKQKKVIYDWGYHYFYSCDIHFDVDYTEGKIFCAGSKISITDVKHFLECNPNSLHDALREFFEGEWGPTAVDTILRLENSGIRVELSNTAEHGPSDCKMFMDNLRKSMLSKYEGMTDEDVEDAVKQICRRCKGLPTDEEANEKVKRLICEELGYQGTPAVTSTSHSYRGMTMRMFMVMLHGPTGNVIQI